MSCLPCGLECHAGQSCWGFWLFARAASAEQIARHKFHGIGFARIGGEIRKEMSVNEAEEEETNDAQILWL
jgi:hypothetical protein